VRLGLLALFLTSLACRPAVAEPLSQWASQVGESLRRHVAERIRPQAKTSSTWAVKNIGRFPLSAPVLASAAVDLDGDLREDLLVLSPEELIAFSLRPGLPVIARVALPPGSAAIASRQPIGTVAVTREKGELLVRVRTSRHDDALVLRWQNEKFKIVRKEAGYPVCASSALKQVAGTYLLRFREDSWRERVVPEDFRAPLWWLGCTRAWISRDSYVTHTLLSVRPSGLEVVSESRCILNASCQPTVKHQRIKNVGIAPVAGDFDGDGALNIAVTGSHPQPQQEQLRVLRLNGDAAEVLFTYVFSGAVVSGVAVEGGRVPIVLTRAPGVARLAVWRISP
jgi:hypothetical protein